MGNGLRQPKRHAIRLDADNFRKLELKQVALLKESRFNVSIQNLANDAIAKGLKMEEGK